MAFDDGPSFEEPGQPYAQDFTVSWTGLVSRSFTLWGRKLAQYIMIAAIPLILYSVIEFVVLYALLGDFAVSLIGAIGSDPTSLILNLFLNNGGVMYLVIIIPLMILSIIISAVVAGATFKFGLDNYGAPDRGDVGESLSYAMARIVPLVLVQLVVAGISLAILLPGLLLMFIGFITMDLYSILMGTLAMSIGALIMLYVSVRLSVASILVIAEDQSVIDAVKKSFDMTRSQFWHIFAGQLLLSIAVGVIGSIITLLQIPILLLSGGFILAVLVSMVIVSIISSIVLSPLSYIFIVVLYRDLQSRTLVTQQEWW